MQVILNQYRREMVINILLSFIDGNVRYCYVYLLKKKDEVVNKLFLYKNEQKNPLNYIEQ